MIRAGIVVCLCARIASATPAEDLRRQALVAAQEGNWELAREMYERSYTLVADPHVLYNLAVAERKTQRLLSARARFTKFLEISDSKTDAALRAKVAVVLNELELEIPRLRILTRGFGPTLVVELDGSPIDAASLATAIAADPGTHAVVAHDGTAFARHSVVLAIRARETVELVAPPSPTKVVEPPPPVIVTRPTPVTPPPPRPRDGGSVVRSPWFWVVTVAVVGGATGAYFALRPETHAGTLGELDLRD